MTLTALTACDARVFVEANGVTCGLEALVMREGTCRVLRMSFLKILKSYAPRTNITIDAEGSGLQLASTRLAISNYSPSAFSPGKFQTFPVTDDWLVLMQRSTLRSRMFPALRQTSQAQAHVRARLG